jgi:hypothetical protein
MFQIVVREIPPPPPTPPQVPIVIGSPILPLLVAFVALLAIGTRAKAITLFDIVLVPLSAFAGVMIGGMITNDVGVAMLGLCVGWFIALIVVGLRIRKKIKKFN